jgi:glycine oxidase
LARVGLCYNNNMTRSADVVILGGGVIGLTAAYYLAREGVRVRLLDQGQVGQEASWAGAGILPPSHPHSARHPFDRLRALSGQLFPALSAELREQTGIDNGYVRCGGLEFLSQSGGAAEQEWCGEGTPCEVLRGDAVARLEPALAPGLGDALLLPTLAQLRNPRHLRALLAACVRTGCVEVHEGVAAQGFERRGERIQAITTSTGPVEAGTFVVATGAWTDRLMAPLGWRADIEPVRGQIVLLHPGNVLFRHVLIWGSRYLVPRADGRVLVGSTEEHAGFEKRNTADGIQGLLQLAIILVPTLADASLERCWSGLRPGSPDGLPFIGRVPEYDNLFLAAGHFRAGIQLSPGTGLLVKEMVLAQPLSLPLEAFRLDRIKAIPAS